MNLPPNNPRTLELSPVRSFDRFALQAPHVAIRSRTCATRCETLLPHDLSFLRLARLKGVERPQAAVAQLGGGLVTRNASGLTLVYERIQGGLLLAGEAEKCGGKYDAAKHESLRVGRYGVYH